MATEEVAIRGFCIEPSDQVGIDIDRLLGFPPKVGFFREVLVMSSKQSIEHHDTPMKVAIKLYYDLIRLQCSHFQKCMNCIDQMVYSGGKVFT